MDEYLKSREVFGRGYSPLELAVNPQLRAIMNMQNKVEPVQEAATVSNIPKPSAATALPNNAAKLPTDANGNPSWLAGPQTQALPDDSPFGQAWGGGQGTTYAPITMNQQAGLLSQNVQAPDGWLNGLLFDSPWQDYYG